MGTTAIGRIGPGAIPSSPPAEVLAAVAAAAKVADQLAARGQHVSFGLRRVTGRIAIEVEDASGRLISRLSPSDVLSLAKGSRLL